MKKRSITQFDTVPVPEALRAAVKTASARREREKTEPYATATKRVASGSPTQPVAGRRRD